MSTANGLKNFAIHRNDSAYSDMMAGLDEAVKDRGQAGAQAFRPQEVNPESAAVGYLNQMIESPKITAIDSRYPVGEYRIIGTQTIPLTGTNVVKFAQYRDHIPVYGSLVAVELDEHNSLLAAKVALGDPHGVDPIATLSPAQAQETVRSDSGGSALHEAPRLYYYFDNHVNPNRWRLVYIARDVEKRTPQEPAAGTLGVAPMPQVVDYVVDAHDGQIVARLPKTQTMGWKSAEETAIDELGQQRQIRVQRDDNNRRALNDALLNIWTYNFDYQDLNSEAASQLPGNIVTNPPDPWDRGAVSAHANAAVVMNFLMQVLQRKGLDDRGGRLISSVNCIYHNVKFGLMEPDNNPQPSEPRADNLLPFPIDERVYKQWPNACFHGNQMLYGQRILRISDEHGRVVEWTLRSFASSLDTVAHEMTHGLTQYTAGLQYIGETGALNESYSDIFGVIVSNWHIPDINDWNWELGEDLTDTDIPIRDLKYPTRCQQPDNMKNFRQLESWQTPQDDNDNGWVHVNSGIHNKAAYNLISATKSYGVPVITARESASLFYLALTQYLAPTSTFVDSRRMVELAAKTLFRGEEATTRQEKLAAIAAAFDDVGIVE